MGQAGWGRWAIICCGSPLPRLAMESATAGCAPWKADAIWGGRTANTVGWSNWSSLIWNSAVFFAVLNHRMSVCCTSLAANVSVPPCHPTRCCVTTGHSRAFLALRDIGFIGIACIPKHGTGRSNPLPSYSTAAWFSGGNSIFFEVTICSAGLTPLWICHNWRNSWSSVVTVPSLLLTWGNTSLPFVMRRLASAIAEVTVWPHLSKWKVAARTGVTSVQLRENEKSSNHAQSPMACQETPCHT